jgi:hypothetical protein
MRKDRSLPESGLCFLVYLSREGSTAYMDGGMVAFRSREARACSNSSPALIKTKIQDINTPNADKHAAAESHVVESISAETVCFLMSSFWVRTAADHRVECRLFWSLRIEAFKPV